ncbi:MAG: phosphatase PAP2 family protein [Candidatus Parcubacteria bacterium]|nr:phosphatase PAP2 family protein [Candidatus Parcubacteria bacterium]
MTIDTNIFYFFNNLAGKSAFFDILFIFLAKYLQYLLVILFLAFLFFVQKKNKEKIHIFLITIFSAIVARLGVVELIRLFYHRPRPFIIHNVHQLIPESGYSFPSGHSAFFFAIATAIYFYNKKLGIIFFIAAIFMNVSRIIVGVHYPSDIIGGMFVGVITAWLIHLLAIKIKKKKIST